MTAPSTEYTTAKAEMDAAGAAYDTAVKAYRAGRTGDSEYLIARAVYAAAQAKFDAAFAIEAGWVR